MAAGAAGVLDEPLDCANWNTVRTMFPSSSSGEAAAPEVAAAESPVACWSDPPVLAKATC